MLSASSPWEYGSDPLPKDEVHDHAHPTMGDFYIPPSQHYYNTDGFLTGSHAGDPLDIALDYLVSNSTSFGLQASDLSGYLVSSQYVSQHTGVTHIYLRQSYGNLEIMGADININISSLGEVINIGSSFIAGLGGGNSLIASEPTLGATEALAALANDFDWTFDLAPQVLSAADDSAQTTLLSADALSLEDVAAELVYVPLAGGGVELAWRMLVQTLDYNHAYDASVSATDGDLLYLSDWVDAAAYNVYELPVKNPDDGPRTVVVDPQDPTASPFGWHDTNGVVGPEFTVTRGNNVHAYTDRNDDNVADSGSSPDGTTSLTFNFPLNLAQEPVNYANAAVTNLFYWNNLAHDIFYQYGFNEPSGSFQVNNYGLGGLGNDDVRAEAQDGATVGNINNANFFTPPDGQRPRMQMYEFNRTAINRDGDLDNLIIVHEYGHGVSNRLTGGPANANALDAQQSGGMGEGWSDWFGLMFSQEAGDAKTGAYPVGTYVLGQPANGAGIRRVPYSFNMAIDPLTYDDYNSSNEVHNSGEIWASALWDLNWLLIDEYGFDPDLYNGDGGNNLAMQLVMDGLKLQPANPSFLDGRDAILLADEILTGGANNLTIWTAFARRGMGFSAFDGGNANATSVIAAFDLPTTSTGAVQFDEDGYSIGDVVTVTLRDIDLAGQNTFNLTVTTSGGDSETITLTESATAEGVFIGTLPTASPPRATGNGTLEVLAGDVLTVAYADADDGTGTPVVVSDVAEILNIVDIYTANMDVNPGWSYTGQWAWGTPTGGGSHNRDPSSGHTGTNVVGYNLAGDYPDNLSPTQYATTQAIDCSNYANISLSFRRWLGIENSVFDDANIQVSTNGTTWQTIWQHSGGSFSESAWSLQEYDISAIADGQSTVYVRWGLGPTDFSVTYPGWNLDDVRLRGREVEPPTTGSLFGTKWNDRNGDGTQDPGEPGLPGWVIFLDQNNDGQVVTDHDLEPDDYNVGTLLNTVHPEVTLTAVGASSADVLAGIPSGSFASTGSLGFTHADPFGWGASIHLRLDFANPVDFVSLDAISNNAGEVGLLEAYDAADNLLASDTTALLAAGAVETMSLARSSADIAYVIVGGAATDVVNLDNLHFTQSDLSTVTNASGKYEFLDLEPGDYRVREVERTGWVQTYPGESPLDETLNSLSANYSDITAMVPTRFDFSEGATGSNISDGGFDMYDTGNILNTNLNSFIPYTDGELSSGDSFFGESSQYFTAKFTGLFVMAATNTSVESFIISGNNGADGDGSVNGTVLSTTVGGRQYTIFVKRVFGAGDPSINHIIMVPGDGTGISHSFPEDTNDDLHTLTGLSSVEEIYYALVSRNGGAPLDDESVLNVVNEFLANVSFAIRDVTTVAAGDEITGLDFGNQALPGSIRGQKWHDLNDNGIKDDGEPRLAGWTIFLDSDNDGERDFSEPSTTTDSGGNFVFLDVEPGDYHVGEVLQSGWRQTHPGGGEVSGLIVNGDFEAGKFDSWTLQDSGTGTFVINDGTFDPPSSDGPLPPLAGSYSALSTQPGPGLHVLYQDVAIPSGSQLTLSWKDRIRNHATSYQDPNQEYRVEIRSTSNQVLETVFSTNPGDPFFQEVTARSADLSAYAGQTIRIAFVEQDNLLYFNVHIDDVSISGSVTQGTIPVIVGADEDVVGIDLGNYILRSSIQGLKWHDLDQDGLKDAGEPGLAGWTIYLDSDDDNQLDPEEIFTTTSAEGSYSFTELFPGNYIVREVLQLGWLQTSPLEYELPTIAVFDDPLFVDSGDSVASESDNVQASLTALGFTVTPFAGTTAGVWSSVLGGGRCLADSRA